MKAGSTTLNHHETKPTPDPRITFSPPSDLPKTPTPSPKEKKPKPPKQTQADKRIDFLLKKHFDNDPDFRPLIFRLADHDPTPKKKYLAWLVKHWTDEWNPSELELTRVNTCLDIHRKGAKYFSPLSWTGLLLEDAGYHADIFCYTPQTLQSVYGTIEEIIQTDEENKQIRKGNLVVTAGAEVAYQDEKWTLLRVRTKAALRRLGQGCGWCVCDDGSHGYSYPFDFLLTSDGDRYLANGREIADRWNRSVDPATYAEINLVRAMASDGRDRAVALVNSAIQQKKRHSETNEKKILKHPEQAVRYAEKVVGGVWPAFERSVRVASLSPHYAVEYAIRCRRDRWPRFENKIRRSIQPLARYRAAFPDSFPKTEKEFFEERLADWRLANGNLNRPKMRWSVQFQAESFERHIEFEKHLVTHCSIASLNRYAKLIASLARSRIADEYQIKLDSYFSRNADKDIENVNERLEPLLKKHLPVGRLLLPTNIRTAWM